MFFGEHIYTPLLGIYVRISGPKGIYTSGFHSPTKVLSKGTNGLCVVNQQKFLFLMKAGFSETLTYELWPLALT